MVDEVNPFESLQEQIDTAAAYMDVKEDVLTRLKSPERVLETNLTVEMDDGSLETIPSYRAQFNGDRGPYKGGVRYHPADGDIPTRPPRHRRGRDTHRTRPV